MKEIIVIGGGASGMAAAISAAKKGANVTILEFNDILGKKILSTGNGRCNLTNLYMNPECFRGDDPDFIHNVLEKISLEEIIKFFEELQIFTKNRDDYVYPRCDQASSVRHAFEMRLKQLGVEIVTGVHIEEIVKTKNGYVLKDHTSTKQYSAKKIILACGSKASSISGSDGSGYTLARQLGHSISSIAPALVQLRSEDKSFSKLGGVRADASVSLFIDGHKMAEDKGELQLTNYGISGIPVFQVSRYASKALLEKKRVTTVVDFVPEMDELYFTNYILNRCRSSKHIMSCEILNSIFHEKLISVLLMKSDINKTVWAEKINEEKWIKFCHLCKNYEIIISATNSFEQAQICAGGVRTNEINPSTMESNYSKGAYITGELLDVDGICGGYNLHFAWISGILAGSAAAE